MHTCKDRHIPSYIHRHLYIYIYTYSNLKFSYVGIQSLSSHSLSSFEMYVFNQACCLFLIVCWYSVDDLDFNSLSVTWGSLLFLFIVSFLMQMILVLYISFCSFFALDPMLLESYKNHCLEQSHGIFCQFSSNSSIISDLLFNF
jgi:hypothetical protein